MGEESHQPALVALAANIEDRRTTVARVPGRILLIGRPGVGKTTLVTRICEELSVPASGFYTTEIREGPRRLGFQIRTLDGREGLLAHRELPTGPSVGRYRVAVDEIRRLALPTIQRALTGTGVVVLDEVGPMELTVPELREIALTLLSGAGPFLVTIQERSLGLLDRVPPRERPSPIRVTTANREQLVVPLREELEAAARAQFGQNVEGPGRGGQEGL